MDPLSLAASIAGLISLAGATLKITKDYIHEARHEQETASQIVQELDILHFNLSQLDKFLRSENEAIGYFDDTSVLVSSTHACRTKLTALHDKLIEGFQARRSLLRALRWPLQVKEHRQMILELRSFAQWVQFSLSINGCKLLAKTSADVLDLLRKQLESLNMLQTLDDRTLTMERSLGEQVQISRDTQTREERERILNWISPLKHQTKHHDVCKPRINGTGNWLLQEGDFQRWMSPIQPGSNVLSCSGIQGSGKTILTSIVIDHLKTTFVNRNVGLAHFYFNYQERCSQSAEIVLCSLLKQLAMSKIDIPKPVLDLHQRVKTQQRELQQQDLEQGLSVTCEDYDQTFIVIDALDECDGEHRKDLLQSLAILQKEPSVRIFLTSRPHLSQELSKKLRNPLQIEIGATDFDLRVYLSSKIDDSDNADVIDEDFKEKIVTKVIQAARKMFLLAALQIRTILNKTNGGDMEDALEMLPRDLDDAFAETLQRIQKQPDGQDTLGMKTLLWIAHARRPLLVTELSEALAIKPGSTSLNPRFRESQKRMVDCCYGLVTVDDKSSIIRLVHFSVQEYLYKFQKELFADGERTVAEGCLTYLLFDTFALGPRQDEIEIENMISNNVFVKYATHHWGNHVHSAQNEDVDRLALIFLRAKPQRGCSLQILHYTANLREEYWTAKEARSCNGVHLTAMFGLENLGKQLLDVDKVGVDDATDHGTTALIKAAAGGHVEFTKMLLGRQADRIKENWYGTALHCAAESGKIATILLLLETGLDVDIRDRRGRTSLHCATVSGHPSVMQALLDRGANIDAVCHKDYTPLRYAVVWEQPIDIVRVLLANSANIEIRSSHNVTPLHDAAVMNTEDTALLLLEHGANVHADDIHCGTPLHFAAERNHASIVQHLLNYGANIDAETQNGVTALYLAAGNGGEETVRRLLYNGANVEAGDEEGLTPLDVAIREYHGVIVRLLIAAGAKIHQDPNFATQFQVNDEQENASFSPQAQGPARAAYNSGLGDEEDGERDFNSDVKTLSPRRRACDRCRMRKTKCDGERSGCKHCIERGIECRTTSYARERSELKCNDCTKVFTRACDLTKHSKTHLRPWKCTEAVCKSKDHGWFSEKERDRHINDKHAASPAVYECQFASCQFMSKRESNWKQHMEKAHGLVYTRHRAINVCGGLGSAGGNSKSCDLFELDAEKLLLVNAIATDHQGLANPPMDETTLPWKSAEYDFDFWLGTAPQEAFLNQNNDLLESTGTTMMPTRLSDEEELDSVAGLLGELKVNPDKAAEEHNNMCHLYKDIHTESPTGLERQDIGESPYCSSQLPNHSSQRTSGGAPSSNSKARYTLNRDLESRNRLSFIANKKKVLTQGNEREALHNDSQSPSRSSKCETTVVNISPRPHRRASTGSPQTNDGDVVKATRHVEFDMVQDMKERISKHDMEVQKRWLERRDG